MEKPIDKDARRIANEIVFGKLDEAHKLWGVAIKDLKAFEASSLRNRIRSIVDELEAAKNLTEAMK